MLSDQDLSNLLFAAIGVNRPADGKITSPTARNFQEIRVFVFTDKGVSEYLNKEHALKLVAKGDEAAQKPAEADQKTTETDTKTDAKSDAKTDTKADTEAAKKADAAA